MDANFEYDLGGDSFDFAEMCMFLEDEGVPVDDAFTAVTLRDVVEYVVKHKGASA
jgi:acyl carrier protein